LFLNDLITNYSDKYDVNALVLHGWIYRPDEVPDWIQLTDKFSRKKEFKQLNQSFQLSAGKNIMQLDSININKAIGLNKLCAKELTTTGNSNSNSSSIGSHNMDVTYENVCTFGNDSNDYQMLQWSKYSYALRGSYQKVYESAKSITKYQCQNYGVAHELEQLCLQRLKENYAINMQKINTDSTLPLTVDQCSPIAMKWLEDIKNIIEPYVNDKEWKMFDFTHTIDQSLESHYLLTGEPPSHGIQYLSGKCFTIAFVNTTENIATSFVYFLSNAQGPKDAAHGGMVFTAIDELLGIAVGTTEVAYTANLSVDLRLKCPLLQTLKCVGKIENVEDKGSGKSKKFHVRGHLQTLKGDVIAVGKALFIRPSLGKLQFYNDNNDNYFNSHETMMKSNKQHEMEIMIKKVQVVRENNLIPYKGSDGALYTLLPHASIERENWIKTEIKASIDDLLTDVNCYQASQGNSNGYTGNPQEQQKHILIGALDGKMFHVTFFNERTKVTTSFVKFLWTAEGAGNLAHGGAIATAIDETLFIWAQTKKDALNADELSKRIDEAGGGNGASKNGILSVTANLTVNYRKHVMLNTTMKIETKVDSITKSSDGKVVKCLLSFELTTLDGSVLHNDGTALVISNKEIAFNLAAEMSAKGMFNRSNI